MTREFLTHIYVCIYIYTYMNLVFLIYIVIWWYMSCRYIYICKYINIDIIYIDTCSMAAIAVKSFGLIFVFWSTGPVRLCENSISATHLTFTNVKSLLVNGISASHGMEQFEEQFADANIHINTGWVHYSPTQIDTISRVDSKNPQSYHDFLFGT